MTSMHIAVIINRMAGSVVDREPDSIAQLVTEAFAGTQNKVGVSLVEPQNFETAIGEAFNSGVDAVIIGGGDGSIRTAARLAINSDRIIGVLPLGTMNLLAKDLDIPLELSEAVASLARGTVRRIDVASVNGHYYLCNSLMGLAPRYSERRQSLRGRPLLERLTGYARVLTSMLKSRRRIEIDVDDKDATRRFRVLSTAVANNAYDDGSEFGLRRERLDGGHLTIYMSRHRSGWGLAWAMVRAVFASWKGDPLVTHFDAKSATITLPRRHVTLSNDGEIERFETPLHYKIHPGALRILAPRSIADTTTEPGIQDATAA